MREVRAPEQGVRQADELRNAEGTGNTEFRGADLVLGLELEVAFQAQVEQFTAMEEVLVEVIELWGDAEQAGGIDRGLQVRLESLDTAVQEVDVAVHDVVRHWIHRDVHAVEDGQVRQSGVGGIDRPFAVGHPGAEDVQLLQDVGPDGNFLRVGKGHVADGELPVRFRLVRGAIAGVVPDGHGQGRRAVVREGVRFAEIEALVKAVVAAVAEELGGTDRFGLEGGFGQILSLLDGDVRSVRLELLPEFFVLRELVVDRSDRVPLSGRDKIGHISLFSLIFHLARHFGTVVADVFEVVLDVVGAGLHLAFIVDDQRSAGPADAQERGAGLLGEVRSELRTADLLAHHLDLVAGEAVLPFRETLRGATCGEDAGEDRKYEVFAVHSHKINTFPLLIDKNNI